jgi:chitin disaccharide deacetylase
MARTLIVNADDFGQTEAITRGIQRAHQQGIVTSTSLMVRWPAAEYAAQHADSLDLGLHIDLGEWAYRQANWVPLYERVALDDIAAIEDEIEFQLAEFHRLTGKTPSHIDSHQHVHLAEPVLTVANRFAAQLAVPLRRVAPNIAYCGEFYGQSGKGDPDPQAIRVEALIALIRDLPAGITELACHPGAEQDGTGASTYSSERPREVETLCHPDVRQAIIDERIRLCSFADIMI